MTADRWAEVETLFASALDRQPTARDAYVHARASSPDVAADVMSLLASHERPGGFDLLPNDDDGLDGGRLTAGARLGAWEVVNRVGAGGMGEVYLARRADGQYEQVAALKVLSLVAGGAVAGQRLVAERQILARLSHPSIARLIDGGVSDTGIPFLVMEYVPGERLTTYCAEHHLDLRARLSLFLVVCDAVRYAHEHLVVHRDLKPANIIVTPDGAPKLLDFGIAKLLDGDPTGDTTQSGWRALTPDYASPEQLNGQPITTASDVYQLGVLLHELLVGRRPSRDSNAELVPPSSFDSPLARQLRGDLDAILLKALRAEPAERYRGAAHFADDIARFIDGHPVHARPDSWAYRSRKFARRHSLSLMGTAAVFLLVLAFAIGTQRQSRRTAVERDRAEAVTDFIESVLGRASPNTAGRANESVRDVLDRGAARVQSELSGQPLVQARLLQVIGNVYGEIGVRDSAVVMLTRAVHLLRQSAADRDPELATATRRLGLFLTQTGKFDSAATLLEEAERRLRRDVATGTARFASALTDLGYSWQVHGRLGRADSLLREALMIQERDSVAAAGATLNNLGWIQISRGDMPAAEGYFRKSLAERLRLHGRNHVLVATSLESLGTALSRAGKFAEADSILSEAIELRQRIAPETRADIAGLIYSRAQIRRQQGRLAEAVPMLEQALTMRISDLGDDHFVTANSRNGLALAFEDLGRMAEAEALYRRALRTHQTHFGVDHLNPAFIELNLARLLARTESRLEAIERFTHAIPIARKAQPSNRRFLDDLSSLGALRCETRDQAGGLRDLREAAAALAPPDSSPPRDDYQRALNRLGACQGHNVRR
jgi:serine/threonine-protein kinase